MRHRCLFLATYDNDTVDSNERHADPHIDDLAPNRPATGHLLCTSDAARRLALPMSAADGQLRPFGRKKRKAGCRLNTLGDAENGLTSIGRELIAQLHEHFLELEQHIIRVERVIGRLAAGHDTVKRLLTVPGIGLLTNSDGAGSGGWRREGL